MMSMIRSVVAGMIAALCLSVAAAAGPMEDATAAVKRGDRIAAANIYLPLAEAGDESAQLYLGLLYQRDGGGIVVDYGQAIRWLDRSARQGNFLAQVKLSQYYAVGAGVPKDLVQAYAWLTIAAAGEPDLADAILQSRQQIAPQMTPAQIVEAERRARAFRPVKETGARP